MDDKIFDLLEKITSQLSKEISNFLTDSSFPLKEKIFSPWHILVILCAELFFILREAAINKEDIAELYLIFVQDIKKALDSDFIELKKLDL